MKPYVGALLLFGSLALLSWAVARPQERMLAQFATSLDGRTRGQRHNAVLSASSIHGSVIPAGGTFSFNETVGSYSRDRGYRKAPVSYNGQLIDSWGGGVCQTSTTLYNAALLAGMEIVERNRHRFAPSYVPPGRDAAVAYPAIDLKFRNPHPYPVRIEASYGGTRLEVRFVGPEELGERPQLVSEVRTRHDPGAFNLGDPEGRYGRVRNSGKAGWDVAIYRVTGDRRELISADSYPAMNRIVQTF